MITAAICELMQDSCLCPVGVGVGVRTYWYRTVGTVQYSRNFPILEFLSIDSTVLLYDCTGTVLPP